jgi:hypothetical protein
MANPITNADIICSISPSLKDFDLDSNIILAICKNSILSNKKIGIQKNTKIVIYVCETPLPYRYARDKSFLNRPPPIYAPRVLSIKGLSVSL